MQDNSSVRNGIPAAHTVYGFPSTINDANYLFLNCLKKVQDINYPEAMTVCIEQFFKCSQGQAIEIYWRDNYICPTVEEYQDMAKKSKYGVRTVRRF
jgi:geranylgeranyl diphosphate synthase type 3